MHGQLIPCGGGKTIPLVKSRVILGPTRSGAEALGETGAWLELRLVDGIWFLRDAGYPGGIRVNGQVVHGCPLCDQDVIAFGRSRYRLDLSPAASSAAGPSVIAKPAAAKSVGATGQISKGPAGQPAGSKQPLDPAVTADAAARPQPISPRQTTTSQTVVTQEAVAATTGAGAAAARRSGEPGQPAEAAPSAPVTALAPTAEKKLRGVLLPLGGGASIPLLKARLTIGRDATCDVSLPLPTVSQLHAGLEFLDGFWRIVDLGSRNGIRVDDVVYRKKWVLPGSVITIGTPRFRLLYDLPANTPFPVDELESHVSLLEKAGLAGKADEKSRDARQPGEA